MNIRYSVVAGLVVVTSLFCTESFAQRGRGPGGRSPGGPGFRGGQGDMAFVADREVFHFLLANGDKIERKVKNLKDGVETITESDDPEITAKIQEHVTAMYQRVEKPNPIRMRDPLFAEIFRNSDKIEMKFEDTEKGVKAIETSKDAYVATLIQEHAKVVSLFVKHGFEEAHKNHAVPGKPLTAKQLALNGVCKEGKCCQGKTQPCHKGKGQPCEKCTDQLCENCKNEPQKSTVPVAKDEQM